MLIAHLLKIDDLNASEAVRSCALNLSSDALYVAKSLDLKLRFHLDEEEKVLAMGVTYPKVRMSRERARSEPRLQRQFDKSFPATTRWLKSRLRARDGRTRVSGLLFEHIAPEWFEVYTQVELDGWTIKLACKTPYEEIVPKRKPA